MKTRSNFTKLFWIVIYNFIVINTRVSLLKPLIILVKVRCNFTKLFWIVICNFIVIKTRVSPLKPLTILVKTGASE
jgi:hypothetical protein